MENIQRVAIDAKADGLFSAQVFLNNIKGADQVSAQVLTLGDEPVGESFSVPCFKSAERCYPRKQNGKY